MQFELGEQPDWANVTHAEDLNDDLLSEILNEGPIHSLLYRSYAIVPLEPKTRQLYDEFHSEFAKWCKEPLSEKIKYAFLQFNKSVHSPNQFHGYSEVDGLKEQLMLRLGGKGSNLPYPKHLGEVSAQLMAHFDILCRSLAYKCCNEVGVDVNLVDKLLDPFGDVTQTIDDKEFDKLDDSVNYLIAKNSLIEKDENNFISSTYLPSLYTSSSILDNFHYYDHFEDHPNDSDEENKINENNNLNINQIDLKINGDNIIEENEKKKIKSGVRFVNNHSAHTDSGLLTTVVVTDQPALEVFDNKLQKWIKIESALQRHYIQENKDPNDIYPWRSYACIFWSDSVEYITRTIQDANVVHKKENLMKSCLHRVAKAGGDRYSVVYKQRTTPLYTPARYQEDFELIRRNMIALGIEDISTVIANSPYLSIRKSEANGQQREANALNNQNYFNYCSIS